MAPSCITLTLYNEQIQTIPEHPFWTQNKGWQTADKLVYAQALATRDADRLIWALDPVNEPVSVYNFTVEPDHTYFVGKNHLWVHNANKNCGDRATAGSDKGTAKGAGKFDVHPRVANQLNDPRMGRLQGKLTNDDLQQLANNPKEPANKSREGSAGHEACRCKAQFAINGLSP